MSVSKDHSRATIRAVARHAGVSPATVSRVLSGSRQVSAANRERVLASASELGYSPDVAAQNLATGQSRIVGVVVPDLANPHFTTLVKQLIHASASDSYEVLVADSDELVESECSLAADLLRRCDGVVMCNPRADDASLLALTRNGKPVLFVNRELPGHDVATAMTDVGPAMRDITTHVLELGHRRVAFVGGRVHSYLDGKRWAAVQEACAENDVEPLHIPLDTQVSPWTDIASTVLDAGCTAVLVNNDFGAVSLASTLTRRGVRVPDDISIAGFDDTPLASWFTPALTTARMRTDELGQVAWDAMGRLLADPSEATHSTLVATAVFRESTGPCGAPR